MICPKCKLEQTDGVEVCGRCDIIFERYHNHQKILEEKAADQKPLPNPAEPYTLARVKSFLLYVQPDINPLYFSGRVLLFIIIFAWSFKFVLMPIESNYAGENFLHLVNLPFHEAGHVIFRLFGQFMMMLGGSLIQLLIPLVCFLSFLLRTRDNFAASVTLWWFGESFLDLAPYINDARSLNMMLLGGVTGRDVANYHDWEYILRKLGMLRYDNAIAQTAQIFGITLILLALALGSIALYGQLRKVLLDFRDVE